MSLPVWGTLEKSQIDPEKIEQAIARLIQAHEDDANAHVEIGESLYSHKAAEIIDHLIHSIIADKIKDFEVGREKLMLNKMYIRPNFESLDAWTVVGDGGVGLYLGALRVHSPVGAPGEQYMYTGCDFSDVRWDTKDAVYEAVVDIAYAYTNMICYWGIGNPQVDFIGFKYEDEVFYACWVVGETEYLEEITGIDKTKKHTFRTVLTHGEKLEFYVDEVLKYTTTINLPDADEILVLFYLSVETKDETIAGFHITGLLYLQNR